MPPSTADRYAIDAEASPRVPPFSAPQSQCSLMSELHGKFGSKVVYSGISVEDLVSLPNVNGRIDWVQFVGSVHSVKPYRRVMYARNIRGMHFQTVSRIIKRYRLL